MSRPIGAARMGLLPPYLFAAIEQKIADKRAAGVDIISLGIGDPDTPTPDVVVQRMQQAVAEPSTHQYPSNRGRQSFRDSLAGFYDRRFGVDLNPATEIVPALGAKEAIANLNLALLDPGDVAMASDPGYPVYTNGPLLVGAEPVSMPLVPELGFQPDLHAIPADVLSRARIMYLNYPDRGTPGRCGRGSAPAGRSRCRPWPPAPDRRAPGRRGRKPRRPSPSSRTRCCRRHTRPPAHRPARRR